MSYTYYVKRRENYLPQKYWCNKIFEIYQLKLKIILIIFFRNYMM